MSNRPLMIIGYGSVGQYLLDMILSDRAHRFYNKVVVVSRKSKEEVAPRLNTSIVAGMIKNYSDEVIEVPYEQCDINDVDKLAKIIMEYNPIAIVQCARYFSGVKYGSYSYKNGIGYGVWAPMSVVPIMNVMQAVNRSGIETSVINTSYPDATNAWIGHSFGRSVLCGAGNINHLIPRIKIAMKKLGYNSNDINLVCSHHANTYISKEGDPQDDGWYLSANKVEINKETCMKIFKECNIPMMTDQTRNLMIASDCYALTRGQTKLMHIPGSDCSVGGQRCVVVWSDGNMNVIKSSSIPQDKVDELNMKGLQADGIEDVKEGMITFTDESIKKMKEVFGIDYPKTLDLKDAKEFAEKIHLALLEYDKRI